MIRGFRLRGFLRHLRICLKSYDAASIGRRPKKIFAPVSSNNVNTTNPHSDIVGITLKQSPDSETSTLMSHDDSFPHSSEETHVTVMGPLGGGPGSGRLSLRTQTTSHVPQVSVHVGGVKDKSAPAQSVIVPGQKVASSTGGVVSTNSMR